MDDLEKLQRRVYVLERRLESYLEEQKDALDHQAQFQLSATWGIVRSIGGLLFFAAPAIAIRWIVKWAGVDNWLTWTIGLAAGLVAWYLYAGHVERGYDDDVKKLGKLPDAPALIDRD